MNYLYAVDVIWKKRMQRKASGVQKNVDTRPLTLNVTNTWREGLRHDLLRCCRALCVQITGQVTG